MSTAAVTFKAEETGPNAPAPISNDEAAKAINAQATAGDKPAAPAGDRPAWLPENFKTPEDFAKSAADTRAELTRAQQELAKLKKPAEGEAPPKPAEGEAAPAPAKEGEKPATAEDAAKEIVAKSGFDVAQWQQEFSEKGDVTPEGRKAIAEGLKGVLGENAEQIVNDFVEGQKVRLANYRQQGLEIVGGEEKYGEMLAWAKTAFTAEEITSFNKAVDSFDVNAMQLAIHGLKSKYEAVRGSSPNLITGDNTITSSEAGFASTYEMTKAMSDPRYAKDPAYRKSVEQRAMKSNF